MSDQRDDALLGPVKLLLVAAVAVALLAGFGWLFVVSMLGVPWEIGFPLSVLAGLAMLAWAGGTTTWRLVSGALWAVLVVWVVAWWVARIV